MNIGNYRHYKGGLYLVLGIAAETETEDEYVVFVSLDPTRPGPRMRMRRVSEFVGYVTVPLEWNGTKQVPRYEYVGDV